MEALIKTTQDKIAASRTNKSKADHEKKPIVAKPYVKSLFEKLETAGRNALSIKLKS